MFDRIGLLQIDSVNVLVRSHYLPLFSRLGPYPMRLLDDLAYQRRELFEYWGHAASFIPTSRYALLRHRMTETRPRRRVTELMREQPGYIEAVLDEVRARGPLTVSELDDPGERTGPWWGYGKGKIALEWHFARGDLAVAHREHFARAYDVRERVFTPEVLAAPEIPVGEAQRELLLLAARHHGVGTARDLANYYGLRTLAVRAQLRALVESGALHEVAVEGWDEVAYLHADAAIPRRVQARALLSPFDPVVWERSRVQRLFDFHYRIEIYVPQPQRQFGYYVLPFLLDDRLVGRVDLKADRPRSTLRVPAAHVEASVRPGAHRRVAGELAEELRSMAAWLELDRVVVGRRGNLAAALRGALRR